MIIDIDPATMLPQKGDVVKFSNLGYEWTVEKVLPYTNTIYVESVLGKRKERAAITSILTAKRDTKTRVEPDYTEEYGISDVFID